MDSAFTTRLEHIESVLLSSLPERNNNTWQTASFAAIDAAVTDTHIAGLIDPCRSLLCLGGKRWRPLLLVLCAEMAAESRKATSSSQAAKNFPDGNEYPFDAEKAVYNAYHLTPLVEFAHTASLIHDDIEDSSDTRRGKPAAYITYGTDIAINAGSWLYFEAPVCIESLSLSSEEKNVFYKLYLNELRLLHLGQAMDIEWHRSPSLIPSAAEYTAMVRNKTGTLSRLAVKTGILAGGGSLQDAEKAGKIAEDIGVGFQILDDVTNLTTGNPGKKRGDDIVEGKKSLPVLLHLASHPETKETLSCLFNRARKEGIDSPAVEEAITLLTKSKAVAEAKRQGTELVNKKSRELAGLYGQDGGESAQLIIKLFDSMQGGR
jgi:octaprenyl-diphosphate synthase